MKIYLVTLCVVGVALLGAASLADAAVDLPFTDGFEGVSAGNAPAGAAWSETGGVAAVVQAVDPIEESQTCYVATNQLSLNLSDGHGQNDNVWCLVHVKPGLFTDAPSDAAIDGSTAAFYVDKNKQLNAYSNDQWRTVLSNVPTNDWLAVAVHLDYNNSTWDIYASTSGSFLDTLSKCNDGPLAMKSGYTSTALTNIVIDSELPGRIDYIATSWGGQAVDANTGSNLVIYGRAGALELVTLEGYHYDSTENTLNGQLGLDLKGEVGDGGYVYIQDENGWNQYEFNSGSWQLTDGTTAPGDIHVTSAQAIWMDPDGSSDETTGFMAYDELTETGSDPADIQYVSVFGTDYPEILGWNSLSWPSTTTADQDDGWGQFPLDSGDLMYIIKETGTPALLNYNATVGEWRRGRNKAIETLSLGQQFFYYYSTSGSNAWITTNLP